MFLLYVPPLSPKHGVISKDGVFRRGAGAIKVRGGFWVVDSAGFTFLCAHGFIVLFRSVVVVAQISAQLADVTVREEEEMIISRPSMFVKFDSCKKKKKVHLQVQVKT